MEFWKTLSSVNFVRQNPNSFGPCVRGNTTLYGFSVRNSVLAHYLGLVTSDWLDKEGNASDKHWDASHDPTILNQLSSEHAFDSKNAF